MVPGAGDAGERKGHRLALDEEHPRVPRLRDVGNVALRDRVALAVLAQGLEHHPGVRVPGGEHEHRAPGHAVQRLADDLAVLAQERLHLPHVARDQGGRAALRKPGRVDLLVHVAQALGTVDDEDPGGFSALEDIGAVDVLGVEGRVLAHQEALQGTQGLDHRLPEGEPARGISPHGQRPRAPQGDAVAQHEIALLEVAQGEAARLRGQQHGERRVLGVADGTDRIHHHAHAPGCAHREIMLVAGARGS